MAEQCENCRYWRPTSPNADFEENYRAECRLRPPTQVFLNDDGHLERGTWPMTDFDDWCCEWQPKEADDGR